MDRFVAICLLLIPSLNKMYAILIQEERVRNITQERDVRPDAMALAVQANIKARVVTTAR